MPIIVPKPKLPDLNDRIAVQLYDAERAYEKVAMFPEDDREKAWPHFIALRKVTKGLISTLDHMHGERKRARATIERRCEELAGCTEGSAEEVELRVLAELIEPAKPPQ